MKIEKKQYKIDINADVKKVYETMLGNFDEWTSVFNVSSRFEGNWAKGSKVRFVGINEEGKKEGMVGIIRENDPNKYISIEYIGLIDGDREVTEGPEIEGWAGTYENYTYESKNGKTTVIVDIDVNEHFLDFFDETYPLALKKLKEISE